MGFLRRDKEINYRGGGNICPPPHCRATTEELAESAKEFTDIMDTVFGLLEDATVLMKKPVAEELNGGTRYADWWPRFPNCGKQVREEISKALGCVYEANKMVAVQGYSAQRTLQKESDGI